jgi:hypothetical protein
MSIQEKAFPNPHLTHETGMTIRDYFAAKAMQGLIPEYSMEGWETIVARKAYQVADAMMEARK